MGIVVNVTSRRDPPHAAPRCRRAMTSHCQFGMLERAAVLTDNPPAQACGTDPSDYLYLINARRHNSGSQDRRVESAAQLLPFAGRQQLNELSTGRAQLFLIVFS